MIGLGDDIMLGDDDDDDDEDMQDWEREERALRRAIYDDAEDRRYLPIESLASHDGFRIMEGFAASLEHGRERDALFHALDRRRPFRSFKDALAAFPDVREAWFRYQEGRLREEALAWLRSEGVDAELVSPRAEPAP